MKGSSRIRGLALAVAAGSLLAVPLAMPASAAAQPASCKTVTTALKGTKITAKFTNCAPASLSKGGSAAFTNPPKGTTAGTLKLTLTWSGGKGTTIALVTFKANPKGIGKCPKGNTREAVTGKVTGGTGAAAKLIKKGQQVTSSTCAVTAGPKTGSSTLEKGTLFKL